MRTSLSNIDANQNPPKMSSGRIENLQYNEGPPKINSRRSEN